MATKQKVGGYGSTPQGLQETGAHNKDFHHHTRANPYLFGIRERGDLAFFTLYARMFSQGLLIGAPKLFLFRQYSHKTAAGFRNLAAQTSF